MSRHTPGPWHVEWMHKTIAGIGTDGRIVTPRGPVAYFPESETIGPRYERDDNARLIAAAPELLNALIDALKIVETAEGYESDAAERIRVVLERAGATDAQ